MSKNIAKYIRLSDEDKDINGSLKIESNSVGTQRQLIDSFISKQPELQEYTIAEFCDDGYTGTKFDRPEFIRMIEMCKRGMIECVIVKDFSRFGRDYIEVGDYIDKIFPELGIRFISVNDHFDSNDFKGKTGGFDVAVHNLINSYYSQDLSKKVNTAKRTRVKNGENILPFAPYGYLKDGDQKRYVIDAIAAKNVQLIFRLAADGMASAEIARLLNDYGIPSRSAYAETIHKNINMNNIPQNKLWSGMHVKSIIMNQAYIGNLVYGKTTKGLSVNYRTVSNNQKDWIIIRNAHEPIIDKELFEIANKRLGGRSVGKGIGKTPNVIFKCGYCNKALRPRRNGNLYCRTSEIDRRCQCGRINVSRENLQQKILEAVNKMAEVCFRESEDMVSVPAKNAQEDLEKQIAYLTRQKIQSYEEYRDGKYTRESFAQMNAAVAAEIAQLKEQLLELQEDKKHESRTNKAIWEEMSKISVFNVSQVKQVVQEVKVFSEQQIEIVWNSDEAFNAF